jgi:microcystin degradation protein MlrC
VRARSHTLPRPLVLADVSDNAGGGAASDSTFILDAMIKCGLRDAAIGMFWDPMAVRIAFEAGEGAHLDVRLGGKLSPASGPQLDLGVTVTGLKRDAYLQFGGRDKNFHPVGDMAAFSVDGIVVVCNTRRSQCLSLECFTNLGIDPSTKRVVVVKSMQHFYAAFAPIASEILYVAAPGTIPPNVQDLSYVKASKNQWPFIDNPFPD